MRINWACNAVNSIKKVNIYLLVCMAVFVLMGTGIGVSAASSDTVAIEEFKLSLNTGITYDRTIQKSHIIVDGLGFLPSGKKVVSIDRDVEDKTYRLINMMDHQVVYEGVLVPIGESGMLMGDFSDYTTGGTYRIHQSEVGYSEEFKIDDAIYNDLYKSLYDDLLKIESTSDEATLKTLAHQLLIKDIYSDAFCDDDYLLEVISKLANEKTSEYKEFFKGEIDTDNQDTKDKLRESCELAGILAQGGMVYREADSALYNTCMASARGLYQGLVPYMDSIDGYIRYYAASELYKSTGLLNYRTAIEQIDNEDKSNFKEQDWCFLGDIAYLMSTYRTDYDRCEAILGSYVHKAEELSFSSDKVHYYVQADIDTLDIDDILDNMMTLGLVSYVLSGHEYASIRDNYLHYLNGFNARGINVLESEFYEEIEGISNLNPDMALEACKLLFAIN